MSLFTEQRQTKRINHKSIVTMEIGEHGHFIYGQIKNMSANGLCLQADYALNSGTIVNIKIDKLPYKSEHRRYRALVIWCDIVSDTEAMYSYEVGIKFL